MDAGHPVLPALFAGLHDDTLPFALLAFVLGLRAPDHGALTQERCDFRRAKLRCLFEDHLHVFPLRNCLPQRHAARQRWRFMERYATQFHPLTACFYHLDFSFRAVAIEHGRPVASLHAQDVHGMMRLRTIERETVGIPGKRRYVKTWHVGEESEQKARRQRPRVARAPDNTHSALIMSETTNPPLPAKRVNLRTPDVMAAVQAQVETHYRSEVVERVRANGGVLTVGGVTVKLAKQFGFCYGVERAIDLAYAARKVFADKRVFILGEIIHNPEVNRQIADMGIVNIVGPDRTAHVDGLTPEDVVIVPAFGTDVGTLARIKECGVQIVDTTCGDVMSVWKRVKQNATEDMTSIIHGKASHEETRATASRAVVGGKGHYLIVLTLGDTDFVCEYIRHGGNAEKRAEFLTRFEGAMSDNFDPDLHLQRVGVANQTTMMRGETEEVQRRILAAIKDRDAGATTNFRFFDTICGATQERQDALNDMLVEKMSLLLVVGGYNSSNTSHLAEMGEAVLPTYFIRNAGKMESSRHIIHFDQHKKTEVETEDWLPAAPVVIGVTAGASCPNNLIEETIVRVFELYGIGRDQVLA